MRDARDPEREFTKNTRNAFFSAFTSSSSFVVVVVFVADDDDDETVADGEMTSFIGSPSSALRARSEARTKTQRENKKRETVREKTKLLWGVSRAPVMSICVCSFKGGVHCVVKLSKRFPLARADIFASATDQSICRNKAEL